MSDLQILEAVRETYRKAKEGGVAADPAKVIPLVDAFLAIWPLTQKSTQPLKTGITPIDQLLEFLPFKESVPFPQPLEKDLGEDLTPQGGAVFSGGNWDTSIPDLGNKMREDLMAMAGAKDCTVAGIGHAVSRALAFLASSEYLDQDGVAKALAPYHQDFQNVLKGV